MKKLVFFILGSLLATTMMAQTAKVLNQTETSAQIRFSSPELSVVQVKANGTTYDQLLMDAFHQTDQAGMPSLPIYSRIIEVPLCTKVNVKVNHPSWNKATVKLNHLVAPAQPDRSKSDTTAAVWHFDAKTYASDALVGSPEMVYVEMLGVARDRNLARITYCPVQYNPVSGEVFVNDSVDVEISYEGADLAATREMKQIHHSLGFGPQADLLLTQPGTKDALTNVAPIRYLIVCYSGFRGQMDEFIAWKRKKGFRTDIVYTGDPGVGTTANSIAAYLKGLYTNATVEDPAPTYVLFVGDKEQVPSHNGNNVLDNNHITDLYYATWTDGDNVPDCYYGRFSAQNLSQLTPQISKTLLYEQYAFEDDSYLSKGILVAGVDNHWSNTNALTYGDPACDYVAKTYITADNGYTSVTYYKNNTDFVPTGVTVTGSSLNSSSENALKNLYNAGAGWVNYTAHGSKTSWSEPEFTTSDVAVMTNNNKPMMMIGNCCLSNKFDYSTCFGEALLRKDNNAGAVAYIGGSNNTYWAQDFYWMVGYRTSINNTMNTSYQTSNLGMYDRLFHTHGEDFSARYISTAAMMMAGNMEIQRVNPNSQFVKYYWEIYHVMGDPSLEPYLGQAAPMPFEGDSNMVIGATLDFTTAPYAYVAITQNDSLILVAGRADNQGAISLNIASLTPGAYTLAITAQNHQPRFITLTLVTPNGPYLLVREVQTAAEVVLPGDTVSFSFQVINLGVDVAQQADLYLCSYNPNMMQVLDNVITVNNIAADESRQITGAFRGVLSLNLTDNTRIPLTFMAVCNGDTTYSRASFTVSAPLVSVADVVFNPAPAPGVVSQATISIANNGSVATDNVVVDLSHDFGMATIGEVPVSLGSLDTNQTKTATFEVVFDNDLTSNYAIPFRVVCVHNYGLLDTVVSVSYFNGNLVEDFETGDFSRIAWQQGRNPWIIDQGYGSQSVYGTYQARSKNGLGNSDSSILILPYTYIYDDYIAFDVRVSSEASWDKFFFFIDDDQQLELSGDVNWTHYSFPVTAGSHTFRFRYEKDYSQASGMDCAIIDNVTLPGINRRVNYLHDSTCAGSPYSFCGRSIATDDLGTFVYVDSNATDLYYLSLTVVDAPQLTITASATSVPVGTQVQLSASGANRYQWSTGDTTASIVVTINGTTTYAVTGYMGTCSVSDSITIQATHSINSVAKDMHLMVYPNPANGLLHVTADGTFAAALIDLQGKVVSLKQNQSDDCTFDLQGLTKGLYFVKVTSSDSSAVTKVVVQ